MERLKSDKFLEKVTSKLRIARLQKLMNKKRIPKLRLTDQKHNTHILTLHKSARIAQSGAHTGIKKCCFFLIQKKTTVLIGLMISEPRPANNHMIICFGFYCQYNWKVAVLIVLIDSRMKEILCAIHNAAQFLDFPKNLNRSK